MGLTPFDMVWCKTQLAHMLLYAYFVFGIEPIYRSTQVKKNNKNQKLSAGSDKDFKPGFYIFNFEWPK